MFGALVGAASSVATNIMQAQNAKAQRNFEREENQKTRDYNRQLAAQQNTWNIEQWERENAYNSPYQQMKRYNDAGLNPDLIYGQQNLSASSPQLTSGEPGTPTPSDSFNNLPTWGNVGTASLQGMETAARIRNIDADTENKEADTDKKDAETEGLSIDNIYKALHHKQELKVGDTVIALNIAQKNFTKKQTEEVQYNISKLVEQTKNLKQERKNLKKQYQLCQQQIDSMQNSDKLAVLDYFLRDAKTRADIRLLAAQADVTEQEAEYFVRDFLNKEANINADTKLKDAQRINVGADTNLKAQQWKTNYKYGDKLQQLAIEGLESQNELTSAQARLTVDAADYESAIHKMEMSNGVSRYLTLLCRRFGTALGGIVSAVIRK